MNNQNVHLIQQQQQQQQQREEILLPVIATIMTNNDNNDNLIDRDLIELKRSGGSEKNSAKIELIVYTVFVIVLCLTIFNLYIFYWTVSSLNGTGRSFLHSNKWAKLEIVSENKDKANSKEKKKTIYLKFNGKLQNKQSFQADKFKSINSNGFKIIAKKSIEFDSVLFEKNQHDDAVEQTETDLLRLNSIERKIDFPNGFKLKGFKTNNNNDDVLVCSNNFDMKNKSALLEEDKNGFCLVKNITNIVFSSIKGIDFLQKSLQVNKIQLKRLHSAANSLQLLSKNKSSFRTIQQGSINIKSLDGITLSSQNSFVSLFITI